MAALLWPATLGAAAQKVEREPLTHEPLAQWKLTWSDEFNGTGPVDSGKWKNAVGGHGWGNQELEYYTAGAENAEESGGNLVITARAAPSSYKCWYGPARYTSARLESRGLFSQKYGRFAARIKLPSGEGLWPAFWMRGENIDKVGWPRCGEIDVMEEWGRAPRVVRGSLHGPLPGAGSYDVNKSFQPGPDLSDAFHEYAIEWAPDSVRFFFDHIEYAHFGPGALYGGGRWVFNQPFHLIVNVAVSSQVSAVLPKSLLVDWIRVYAKVKRHHTVNDNPFNSRLAGHGL
jgi:beta-glucanase (GH16 family)